MALFTHLIALIVGGLGGWLTGYFWPRRLEMEKEKRQRDQAEADLRRGNADTVALDLIELDGRITSWILMAESMLKPDILSTLGGLSGLTLPVPKERTVELMQRSDLGVRADEVETVRVSITTFQPVAAMIDLLMQRNPASAKDPKILNELLGTMKAAREAITVLLSSLEGVTSNHVKARIALHRNAAPMWKKILESQAKHKRKDP